LFEFSGTDAFFAALHEPSIAYYTATEHRAKAFYISGIKSARLLQTPALVLPGIGLIGICIARRFRTH
jgi:hypothetical protein